MKKMSGWQWGISLLMAGMLIAGSDMSAYAQAKRVKVLEAHTGTLFMSPVYIAEAAGYMREEGIDLELTEVDSGASLDVHAADMMIPYLALATGPSSFTVREISGHLSSVQWLVGQFVNAKFEVEKIGNLHEITVKPS